MKKKSLVFLSAGAACLLLVVCAVFFLPKWLKPADANEPESFPGKYPQKVYEWVGFSKEEAEKYVKASNEQVEALTTARMVYIVEADAEFQRSSPTDEGIFDFDVYSVDFTDEEISKKVSERYNYYLKSSTVQDSLDRQIEYFIHVYGMSYQDRRDYYYQTRGFKDQADYTAWQKAQIEEQRQKIKAEEDRINAERAKQGLGPLWPDEM